MAHVTQKSSSKKSFQNKLEKQDTGFCNQILNTGNLFSLIWLCLELMRHETFRTGRIFSFLAPTLSETQGRTCWIFSPVAPTLPGVKHSWNFWNTVSCIQYPLPLSYEIREHLRTMLNANFLASLFLFSRDNFSLKETKLKTGE